MNRRELIGAVGGLGAACLLNTPNVLGDDHDWKETMDQDNRAPLHAFHLYLCAFHTAKLKASFQIEAHHYCSQLNEDLHQCLIYSGRETGSKLLGTEYIISDQLYRELPEAEKKYWHPHAYEVLSGQLIAPGVPEDEQLKLMKKLIPTWGKSFHTWPDPQTKVPMGEPLLMWSLTGDGQIDKKLLASRDRLFDVSTEEIRARRERAFGLPIPQVPQPDNLNFIGRQWNDAGPDTPEQRRKQLDSGK